MMEDNVKKDSRMRVFEEDCVILKEGTNNDTMYKVVKGKVAVYLHYGTEDEYLVCVLSEGKCFGEIGLFSGRAEIYTVVAVTQVLVLKIRREHMVDFVTENHGDIIDIMQSMANTIYAMKANVDMLSDEVKHKSLTAERLSDIEQNLYKSVLDADGEELL